MQSESQSTNAGNSATKSALSRAADAAEADLRDAAEYYARIPALVVDLMGNLSEQEEGDRRQIDGDTCRAILADVAAAIRAMHERAEDARKTLDAAQRQARKAEPAGDLASPPPPAGDPDDAVSGAVADIERGIAAAVAIAGDLQMGVIAAPTELFTAMGRIASAMETLASRAGYCGPAPQDSADLTIEAARRRGVNLEGASHA